MAKKRAKERKQKQAAAEVGSPGGTPRPLIPRWLPATIFVALTLWLFRAFVFTDQMLLGGDTLSLGYVARAFYATVLKGGGFPAWNPQILGGTPFLEALSGGDSLYPPSAFLLFFLEPYRALGWKLVLHVLAAGFSTCSPPGSSCSDGSGSWEARGRRPWWPAWRTCWLPSS
jgi:hypothetical protein